MPNQKLSLTNPDVLSVSDCFCEYLNHCIIKNLSTETIQLYKNQFKVFQSTLTEDMLISDITINDVNNFIIYLRTNHNCNDITINSYLRGIRAFLYYAMEENHLRTFKVIIPKVEKKIKETYLDSELKVLLKKPNMKTATFSEYKIWVFSNYLLATGNRLSSALSIQIKDLDFDNQQIQINKTKNRKAQLIPMSDSLCKILKEYLRYRKGAPDDYVFCNTRGGKGDLRTYEDMLYSYNRKRGVTKTSAHLYRHTFAKKWILNGGDIFRLQKILGHSDLSVVKEYVQMFGNDLSTDFEKFNPLDRMELGCVKPKLSLRK